jgi:hypothetical protein
VIQGGCEREGRHANNYYSGDDDDDGECEVLALSAAVGCGEGTRGGREKSSLRLVGCPQGFGLARALPRRREAFVTTLAMEG